MKYIKFLIIPIAFTLFNIGCGEQKLPYPLEDVKKGVVIDILQSENSTLLLSPGSTDIECKIELTIPKYQGDYSMLDYAQLMCVFTGVDGKRKSFVFGEQIREFPAEIVFNMADLYKEIGLSTITSREEVSITTNAYLKDGTFIEGWNKLSGYNNVSFSGWPNVEQGRSYSPYAIYPAVCPLNLDDFVGEFVLNGFVFKNKEVDIIKKSETDLELTIKPENTKFVITLIEKSHTISGEKQLLLPSLDIYTNLSIDGVRGRINMCDKKITVIGDFSVDQGSFGADQFVISAKAP